MRNHGARHASDSGTLTEIVEAERERLCHAFGTMDQLFQSSDCPTSDTAGATGSGESDSVIDAGAIAA